MNIAVLFKTMFLRCVARDIVESGTIWYGKAVILGPESLQHGSISFANHIVDRQSTMAFTKRPTFCPARLPQGQPMEIRVANAFART
ncbi:hypothetical protein NA8A_08534 [Nitratireductor indicus C115]|uniref:Uncharacterized protein n=1 Tax=Nitratireductor indicus C115 TaxID=1231190 RepID=K2NTT2_9HYPH|nr:hypothetical protein NA8A_08534 [Nitratireductor indicus C115]